MALSPFAKSFSGCASALNENPAYAGTSSESQEHASTIAHLQHF